MNQKPIAAIQLPYQSAVQPPSELDHHFEIAWTKSLRRRFLWYCGVTLGLALPEILILVLLRLFSIEVFNPVSDAILLFETLARLAAYVTAFVYAWRLPPRRKAILALAFWVYVSVSILALLIGRYQPKPSYSPALAQATSQPASGSDLITKVRTAPATGPTYLSQAARARTFAWEAPVDILFRHLFICLFLPWNFRQSVRPALLILGADATIAILDVALGRVGMGGLLSPVFVMLAFIPGSAWCWWRFSAFRSQFNVYYESSAYRKLQAELGNARRIHETQLPAMRTHGPLQLYYAYEPMRQIGGDLLFVYPPAGTPTDKLTAVVFDVTGHGIAAALFVNRLVGELERCFGENPNATPADALIALNSHVFYTLAKHSMFVTAIAVQLDCRQNSLCYASGGHPDAFLVRGDGTLQRLESTTYMLGVIDPKSFESEAVTLPFQPTDSMVLYTDGAMEANSTESGQQLGMDGLANLIGNISKASCSQWPGYLLAAVAAYRQAPPEDDTLVVALCRG